MIQRKQTLFLLATAIIAIIMLFVPVFSYQGDTGNGTWDLINSVSSVSNAIYLMIFDILVILLSFITIFLFKNRVVQYKLANLLVLLNVFFTGLAYLLTFDAPLFSTTVSLWAILPIANAVLAFFAGHFIKKDELLVRSANRIR